MEMGWQADDHDIEAPAPAGRTVKNLDLFFFFLK